MDKLLEKISYDLKIKPYKGENLTLYKSRLIFSAIASWTLTFAQSSNSIESNKLLVSKAYITRKVNQVLNKFIALYPDISTYFIKEDYGVEDFSKDIRTFYQSTGYLLSKENKVQLANFGRRIAVGNKDLFFGNTVEPCKMSGIGQYLEKSIGSQKFSSLFINNYSSMEIVEEIINGNSLEFMECKEEDFVKCRKFNPLSKESNYNSWIYERKTLCTIVEYNETEYAIIKEVGGQLFYSILSEAYSKKNIEEIYNKEYIRLMFGLKAYYQNSEIVRINNIDRNYLILHLKSHLPYYERALLMLIGWPSRYSNDYGQFIVRQDSKEVVKEILELLDLTVEEN